METIEALNRMIGQKITSFDISDDHSCITLLCEDNNEPLIFQIISSREIGVSTND